MTAMGQPPVCRCPVRLGKDTAIGQRRHRSRDTAADDVIKMDAISALQPVWWLTHTNKHTFIWKNYKKMPAGSMPTDYAAVRQRRANVALTLTLTFWVYTGYSCPESVHTIFDFSRCP